MIGHDFPYLDTRDLNLDWLLKNMKLIIKQWADYQEHMDKQFSDLETAFNNLKDWIDSYFENLDVQTEINNKLAAMKASGELGEIMQPIISDETAAWLAAHITQPTTPAIDSSLTVQGAAADAKATGDRLAELTDTLDDNTAVLGNKLHLNYMAALDGTEINKNGITGSIKDGRVRLSGTPTSSFGITILDSKKPFAILPTEGFFWVDINGLNNQQIIVMFYCKDAGGNTYEVYRTSSDIHGTVGIPTDIDIAEYIISISVIAGNAINVDFTINIENILKDVSIKSMLATGLQYDLLTNVYFGLDRYSANGVTVTRSNGVYTISGRATASNAFELYNMQRDRLKEFAAGKDYTVHFLNADDVKLYLQLLYNTASATEQVIYSGTASIDRSFTIPENATNFYVRFTYINGTVYNNKIELYITEKSEMLEKKKYFFTSEYGGSLFRTVKAAEIFEDSVVILDNGTYDIVQEFIAAYGEAFFTSYTTSHKDGWGLEIGNGLTLRAYTDAVINCDCSAYDAANVYESFSPFMLVGDCTLENLTINATHCKYCVHDDWKDKTVKARHEYKNCKMYHYGTGLRCIGGGLTNASEIIIKDCIFEMDKSEPPVSYHNCVNAGAVSRGVISGNYFKTGYLRITNYGASTKMTQFIVSNNSFAPGSPETIVPGFEDRTHYPNVNVEVLQFNNIVRTE